MKGMCLLFFSIIYLISNSLIIPWKNATPACGSDRPRPNLTSWAKTRPAPLEALPIPALPGSRGVVYQLVGLPFKTMGDQKGVLEKYGLLGIGHLVGNSILAHRKNKVSQVSMVVFQWVFFAKKTKNLEIFPFCFLRVKFWEMIVMFASVIPKRHPQTKPWFSIASTQKRGLFVEDHRIVTG